MLESLVFSLNVTVPIILVSIIGYILGRRGFFSGDFLTVLDKLVYRVMLPLLLFRDVSAGRLSEGFDVRFFSFNFVSTLVYITVIWIAAALLLKDKKMIGAFVQGAYRGSIALLGITFVQSIYGDSGMMPIAIVAVVPLYNIFAVIILTIHGDNGEVHGAALAKKCLRGLVTNPILIGIFFGLLTSFLQIDLPAFAGKTINYFAVCTSPLALLMIGAEFEGRQALKKLKPTAIASLIKLVILPGIVLPMAVFFGFRGQALVATLIVTGAPSTATGYIMAKNLNNDGVLSSSVIMTTTALSSVTVTGILFILRAMALI